MARAQTPAPDFEAPAPTPVTPAQAPEKLGLPVSTTGLPVPVIVTANDRVDDWRFWVNADYGLAWLKGRPLPPLATTSPPGTGQAAAGVLGLKTTSVLIGNAPARSDERSLGALEFGCWFNPEKSLGAAAGFFVTSSKGRGISTTSDGTTIIARPFTDAASSVPTSVLVAFPGVSNGSVNVYSAMQTFWGANADLRENILSTSCVRMESLVGYRYLHYGENLNMQQTLNATGGVFVPGTNIVSTDSFQTINDFNGCEFGLRTEVFGDRWSLEILTKMAAGNLRREIIINGSTQTTVPGSTTTTGVGGVYALSSNIGNHFNDSWVVAPEFGLTVGYQVLPNVRVHAGYSFLFLQGIARAADQIDFTLNQNLFPPPISGGPNRPTFNLIRSDIWIQTVSVGVEIRF
jgi:hypothetical protein